MVEAALQTSHGRAIARRGVPVTFRRISGSPPNATALNVVVTAIVMTILPDQLSSAKSGYAEAQVGAMTQKGRRILVLASDLSGGGFPLPVKENDTILLADGRRLNVTTVDAETRALAGAIDITASGVNV